MGSEHIELNLRSGASRAPTPPPATDRAPESPEESCAVSCPQWIAQAEEVDRGRREDLATVMTVVNETVAALGAEMSSLHDDLTDSTTRFDAIVEIEDPEVIRERLIAEVLALKNVAVDGKGRWEAKSREYSDRMSRLEVQLKETRSEASTDALTGLVNRRAFDRHLEMRLKAPGANFVLVAIDVDNFKGVNDTYGHAAGDQVLLAIAKALQQAVRPGDIVARLGGDEFAVIADDVTLRQAEGRFKAVIAAVSEATTATMAQRVEDTSIATPPSISCGIAECSAGDTSASLLRRSDAALYDAKHAGKGRVASRELAFMRDLLRGNGPCPN